MQMSEPKSYMVKGQLVLMKPEAIRAFCFVEDYKPADVTELVGKPPASVGLARVKVAINNMTRDKKDWIFV